jgi:hypothetical protein
MGHLGVNLIAMAFLGWFILSLLVQFRCFRAIRRFDIFRLLPAYAFFAATPVVYNLYLFCRYQAKGGVASDWQRLELGSGRPGVWFLWNPGRSARNALRNHLKAIGRLVESDSKRTEILTSPAHSYLVNLLHSRTKAHVDCQGQFRIVKADPLSNDKSSDDELFLSDFHSFGQI